jgi:PAB1-binding protein PBP1
VINGFGIPGGMMISGCMETGPAQMNANFMSGRISPDTAAGFQGTCLST